MSRMKGLSGRGNPKTGVVVNAVFNNMKAEFCRGPHRKSDFFFPLPPANSKKELLVVHNSAHDPYDNSENQGTPRRLSHILGQASLQPKLRWKDQEKHLLY